jgi:hypothetical protein
VTSLKIQVDGRSRLTIWFERTILQEEEASLKNRSPERRSGWYARDERAKGVFLAILATSFEAIRIFPSYTLFSCLFEKRFLILKRYKEFQTI